MPEQSPTHASAHTRWLHRAFLAAMVAVGAYLRLWRLPAQIPVADEWQAIAYVVQHDFRDLLTHYARLGAGSVPHDLYLRLALRTVGLSEWSIALPSLLAGLLLLWYFPRWVWARLGAAAGMVSGLLLAFAPFLIFHSRLAGPYAPLLLLELLALGCLAEWLRSARSRDAVAAVAFGAAAIWVQLFAAPPLLAAWIVAGLWQRRAQRGAAAAGPTPTRVLAAGALMTAVAGLLTLPALLFASHPAPAATTPFTARTLDVVSQLLLGSARFELRLLLAGASVVGLWLAARQAPREVALLVAAALGSIVAVLAIHPALGEVGAVFARSSLPLFLLVFLSVAAAARGLVGELESPGLRRVVGAVGLLALATCLYYSGPLPFVFADHASFTKHPVFQYQYADPDEDRTLPDPVADGFLPLVRTQLHPFYTLLARERQDEPIIEYPFLIGEQMNRLYFAQMLHGHPVLAGYYPSGTAWSDGGSPVPDLAVDDVLAPLTDRSAIRFRTVVDLMDPSAIRASGARYVVLHWNLPRELLLLEVASDLGVARGRFVARIAERLAATFGDPVVNDEVLTVFRVPP